MGEIDDLRREFKRFVEETNQELGVLKGLIDGRTRFTNLMAESAYFSKMPVGGIRVIRDTTQAISTSTYTDIEFDSLDYESYQEGWKIFDPDKSTTKLYIPVSDVWEFFGDVRFAANGTGIREVWIYSNRTEDAAGGHVAMAHGYPIAGTAIAVPFVGSFKFDAGDWVSLRVWQNSGGALNIDNARLSLRRG